MTKSQISAGHCFANIHLKNLDGILVFKFHFLISIMKLNSLQEFLIVMELWQLDCKVRCRVSGISAFYLKLSVLPLRT